MNTPMNSITIALDACYAAEFAVEAGDPAALSVAEDLRTAAWRYLVAVHPDAADPPTETAPVNFMTVDRLLDAWTDEPVHTGGVKIPGDLSSINGKPVSEMTPSELTDAVRNRVPVGV